MPPQQRFATDYIDVAARLVAFREQHPEGSLQPADLDRPYTVETIEGTTYIVCVAAAYRSPDDPRPGIGMAYEVFPGKSNFTRGSELQNAETSAWGRAIVAALAADTRQGIASAQEVRNRAAEPEPTPADAARRDLRRWCADNRKPLAEVNDQHIVLHGRGVADETDPALIRAHMAGAS